MMLFGDVTDQISLFQLLISRKKFHEIIVQKQLVPDRVLLPGK